jgi:hypothetical protein
MSSDQNPSDPTKKPIAGYLSKKLQKSSEKTSDEDVREKIRSVEYQKVSNIHKELDEEEEELKQYFDNMDAPVEEDPTLVSNHPHP